MSPWTARIVLAMLVVPLLWPLLPPLIDLPGHLGRYHVMREVDHNAALQQFFKFEWRLIPNLGVDLLVMLLAPLVGVEVATKIIVMLIPLMTGAGFLLIARNVHGRIPPTALFALPLCYHYPFQFGFLNFSLSMALAMLAFGLWLQMTRWRTGVFAIIAPILWLMHIYGWAVLSLLVVTWVFVSELSNGSPPLRALRRTFLECLPFVSPLVLTALWRDSGTSVATGWFDFGIVIKWIVTILRDNIRSFDLASALLVYAIAALPIIFRRQFAFNAPLAACALALWLCVLVLPEKLSGSSFANVRLIPFVLAFSVITIRPTNARWSKMIMTAALLFLSARMAMHTATYINADRNNQRILTALDHIPNGARIVTQVGQRCGQWAPSRFLHIPEMATVRRDAFTNGHWALTGGQLLGVTYQTGAPFVVDPSQYVDVTGCAGLVDPLPQSWAKIPLNAFDYLWVVEVPKDQWPIDSRLQRVWASGQSVLFRIVPGAGIAR